MARRITPFSEKSRQDILDTLAYIQELKAQEAGLKRQRQEAEDWLKEAVGFDPSKAGTVHFGDEDDFVSFEVGTDYKVDEKALQELVQEHRVSEETAERVFRWKAEVNATEWRGLDEETRAVLSAAVTSKTGSPSIKINLSKEK